MSDASYKRKNSQKDVETYLMGLHRSGMTWREIALLPGLYGIPFGSLERYAKGREVKHPVHREQLGMEPMSANCGQCFRVTEDSVRKMRRSRPKRIQDYPLEMLRVALEHREEI
jgi:hypothetical protein